MTSVSPILPTFGNISCLHNTERLPLPPRAYRRNYKNDYIGQGFARLDWAVERGLITFLEAHQIITLDQAMGEADLARQLAPDDE